MIFASAANSALPQLAPELVRILPQQWVRAFIDYPDVVAAFVSMGLAAILISLFWLVRGATKASAAARIALRAQALKRAKDHRALILIGYIDGGGHGLRQELKRAIEDNFGLFAFQAEAVVELFPVRLGVPAPARANPKANAEKRRRIAQAAVDILDKSAADVIIWGKRGMFGPLDLRMTTVPAFGRVPEVDVVQLGWRARRTGESVQQALAYACARRARPVLNRPQDYKPERLQPIVEALDRLVEDPPEEISDGVMMDILNDFASGALSLGERGGHMRWLQKSLDARQRYLDQVDRSIDQAAWGAAQQEIGRALAALGEREGAKDKLEEAVSRLKLAMDALRATESLQNAEVAMRALQRAEQTLIQRKRIGLRWPV
ncbi:MAG: hypothetical protein HXY28_02480 [Hydrogenophilaceae bacterium]|nr:hypothetical protein [Hydrogenophilaceae bacterium]